MGLFFRKSIKLGKGLKLNLSKSGFGISTGVKGFRIGINAKGNTYINAGKNGIYYRKQFNNKNEKQDILEKQNSHIGDVLSDEVNYKEGLNYFDYLGYQKSRNKTIKFILSGFLSIALSILFILFLFPALILLVIGLYFALRHAFKYGSSWKYFFEIEKQNFHRPIKTESEFNEIYKQVKEKYLNSINQLSEEQKERRNKSKYKDYKYSYETYKKNTPKKII